MHDRKHHCKRTNDPLTKLYDWSNLKLSYLKAIARNKKYHTPHCSFSRTSLPRCVFTFDFWNCICIHRENARNWGRACSACFVEDREKCYEKMLNGVTRSIFLWTCFFRECNDATCTISCFSLFLK